MSSPRRLVISAVPSPLPSRRLCRHVAPAIASLCASSPPPARLPAPRFPVPLSCHTCRRVALCFVGPAIVSPRALSPLGLVTPATSSPRCLVISALSSPKASSPWPSCRSLAVSLLP
ncbi:hypothetical protein OF83DRAFT_1180156, partial [Amylostereum chailletii]